MTTSETIRPDRLRALIVKGKREDVNPPITSFHFDTPQWPTTAPIATTVQFINVTPTFQFVLAGVNHCTIAKGDPEPPQPPQHCPLCSINDTSTSSSSTSMILHPYCAQCIAWLEQERNASEHKVVVCCSRCTGVKKFTVTLSSKDEKQSIAQLGPCQFGGFRLSEGKHRQQEDLMEVEQACSSVAAAAAVPLLPSSLPIQEQLEKLTNSLKESMAFATLTNEQLNNATAASSTTTAIATNNKKRLRLDKEEGEVVDDEEEEEGMAPPAAKRPCLHQAEPTPHVVEEEVFDHTDGDEDTAVFFTNERSTDSFDARNSNTTTTTKAKTTTTTTRGRSRSRSRSRSFSRSHSRTPSPSRSRTPSPLPRVTERDRSPPRSSVRGGGNNSNNTNNKVYSSPAAAVMATAPTTTTTTKRPILERITDHGSADPVPFVTNGQWDIRLQRENLKHFVANNNDAGNTLVAYALNERIRYYELGGRVITTKPGFMNALFAFHKATYSEKLRKAVKDLSPTKEDILAAECLVIPFEFKKQMWCLALIFNPGRYASGGGGGGGTTTAEEAKERGTYMTVLNPYKADNRESYSGYGQIRSNIYDWMNYLLEVKEEVAINSPHHLYGLPVLDVRHQRSNKPSDSALLIFAYMNRLCESMSRKERSSILLDRDWFNPVLRSQSMVSPIRKAGVPLDLIFDRINRESIPSAKKVVFLIDVMDLINRLPPHKRTPDEEHRIRRSFADYEKRLL